VTAEGGGGSRVRALLVTHAGLGEELIRTAESILGPFDGVAFVTNAGASLESLSEAVKGRLGDEAGPLILFVDLQGGSCSHVCSGIRGLHPGCAVFSGVNLPMLLEFLCSRDRVAFSELKERILEKGRSGIQCL